jgi:hypothetical protein
LEGVEHSFAHTANGVTPFDGADLWPENNDPWNESRPNFSKPTLIQQNYLMTIWTSIATRRNGHNDIRSWSVKNENNGPGFPIVRTAIPKDKGVAEDLAGD